MKTKKKIYFVILVLITIVLAIWLYEFFGSRFSLRIYHNISGGYTISLPNKWITEENSDEIFVSRLVSSPGDGVYSLGNIAQLSVTVIASPSANQAFSRPEEFSDWRNEPSKKIFGTGLLKIRNETVAGKDAITLAEVDIVQEDLGKSFWSVTTWFRNGEVNYYINMMGNGAITDIELESYSKILASFKFD